MNNDLIDQAKHRVILGELRIAQQEISIVQLERDGQDTTQAHKVLASFKDELVQAREHLRQFLEAAT